MPVKQLAKIRTGNPDLDRVQDHFAGVLNPLLRALPASADFIAGEGDAAQVGAALTVPAGSNTFTDLPGTTLTFSPRSAERRIKATLCFTGYASGGAGLTQVRLLVNGKQMGAAYPVYDNTLAQHQSWTFQWPLSPGALGPAGSIASIKAQLQSPAGSASQFNMDANDSSSLIVEEMG